LPTAVPIKVMALAIIFFVFPPVLLVTSAKDREKVALEAPVKSARHIS
jgi:hypothetical protein